MAEWIKTGENPQAPGSISYGIEGQPASITMDSAGNITASGKVQSVGTQSLTGDLLVSANDPNGAVYIANASTVTSQGDVFLLEATAASIALGIEVAGEIFSRLQVLASGQIAWGGGTGPADVNLARSAAGLLALTSASLTVGTAGQGLRVAEGTNAKQGTAVLSAGSKVVANTSVTATSRIFLTSQADGGTPGFLRVSARTAGTSFTITSSSGTDTSTVAYQIFEQG